MKKEKISNIQTYICIIYVALVLMSNIIASRQIALGWFEQNAGLLTFPLIFILSDVISEVFGYGWSRKTAWVAFSLNIFMATVFYFVCMLPAPVWFTDTEAFSTVLQAVPRITAASLIAFMLGDWLNDIIFKKLKGDKGDKGYAFRAIVSSLFGEFVDSGVFLILAFLGTMPIGNMCRMIPLYVAAKLLYEIIFLPINIAIMKKVKAIHLKQIGQE